MAPEQIKLTRTDKAGKSYRVSTILIVSGGVAEYETMVFPGNNGWREVDSRRDESHRAALKTHRELVAAWSD